MLYYLFTIIIYYLIIKVIFITEPSTSIGELQQNTVRMKHRSTSISPERIFNSPTKCRMRKIHAEEIRSLKRKLYDVNHKWTKIKEEHLTLKKNFFKITKTQFNYRR